MSLPAQQSSAVALPEIRSLIRRLELEASLPSAEANRNTALSIMESVLEAESEEQLFERQEAGLVSSKDYLNRPFRLLPENIDWKKSNSAFIDQGGFPYFAIMRVQDMESGDTVAVDAGSPSVVAVLSKLLEWDADSERDEDKRPFEKYRQQGGKPLMFVGKAASSGYTVVLLKPVAMQATPGESKPRRVR